jgi:hypothetical protein
MVFDLIEIFIDRFMTETELILYCDFHGHSRKQNVFIYGCENNHIPGERLKERIFPVMLSKNDPTKVRFSILPETLFLIIILVFILFV